MSKSNTSPIKCTPCRVTYKQLSPSELAGIRFYIQSNGDVFYPDGSQLKPEFAKLVRREASRQRRNRNARENNQAKRDLGLKRAPGGAFGGWE